MKYPLLAFSLNLFLFSIGQKTNSIKQFQWLEGTWKSDSEESFEKWDFADDTLFTGLVYHIEIEEDEDNEKETVITEAIRLVSREGGFFYIPLLPAQNKLVEFEVVSFTKNSFVAENRKHDFPTRIVYSQESPNKLSAYIEGKVNNKKKRIDYRFTRQPK